MAIYLRIEDIPAITREAARRLPPFERQVRMVNTIAAINEPERVLQAAVAGRLPDGHTAASLLADAAGRDAALVAASRRAVAALISDAGGAVVGRAVARGETVWAAVTAELTRQLEHIDPALRDCSGLDLRRHRFVAHLYAAGLLLREPDATLPVPQ
jgi:hypothetical protein